ncbi:protein of unknown function [Methylacidimicrobium sp. AP8]|uniref:hypothetical protein n=1 Tax=Methylacidimicrobium sp. AP8 TaxID=2730359 RepID=UPI0018C034EB|nr:hypothetical protein [Methylacidimicrobium sp. AP8]CAB4243584.1 protein of unknown function [Methylacidimicrobium sp. AP8]
MHEVNGFALLNEAEVALVLGPSGQGSGPIVRIGAPSLSRAGMEALRREAESLSGQWPRLARTSDPGSLLAERLERMAAAQEARSDSAACSATAMALRDPQWRTNPAVLADLARVTDRMGRPCAVASEAEGGTETAVEGDRIPSFEEFVSSVHRSLPAEQRRRLANLYEELAAAYRSRYEALLRYHWVLAGAENARQRSCPWSAKGYYRPMRDGRDRVLADAQGRIFFEYVNPASPTRWARKAARAAALACGSGREQADRFAERFHFLDIAAGELRAGLENTASHFFHMVNSKNVTDPYARAFAIVFWSVKDFLDSRSGEYPEVVRGAALREAAGKAAALLALPQERARAEEELAAIDRRIGAREREMEAVLGQNGWRPGERRAAPRAPVAHGGDRSR